MRERGRGREREKERGEDRERERDHRRTTKSPSSLSPEGVDQQGPQRARAERTAATTHNDRVEIPGGGTSEPCLLKNNIRGGTPDTGR